MVKIGKVLIIVILALLCINLSLAAKPTPQIDDVSLTIIYPKAQAYTFGEDFRIYIMVANSTTGITLTNSSVGCVLFISNHSNNDIVYQKYQT